MKPVTLVLIRNFSTQVKYVLAFASLFAILTWSGITFYKAYNYALEKKELAKNIVSTSGYFSELLKSGLNEESTKVKETETSNLSVNLSNIRIRAFFQRNFDLLILAWMAGMLFFLFRLVGGFVYAHKLRTEKIFNLPLDWQDKFAYYADKICLKWSVLAFQSALAKSPMALGVFKPVVLFPISIFTGMDTKTS